MFGNFGPYGFRLSDRIFFQGSWANPKILVDFTVVDNDMGQKLIKGAFAFLAARLQAL